MTDSGAETSSHRSSLNDILPIDVFNYILTFAHRYFQDSGTSKTDITAFTGHVSTVCSSWRNSALRIPCLWSTIVFDKPSVPSFGRQARWIERSQDVPLDIRVDEAVWVKESYYETMDKIQELVRPEAHRWRELAIPNAPLETIPVFFHKVWGEQVSAPMLEQLMVSGDSAKSVDDDLGGWALDFFSQTPNLGTLYVENFPARFPSPMFQAECLKNLRISGLTLSHDCDIIVSQVLFLLRSKGLQELVIPFHVDLSGDGPTVQGLPTEHSVVRSESLRSFGVPSYAFPDLLPYIDLPNLQHLSGISLEHFSDIRDWAQLPLGIESLSLDEPSVQDLPNLTPLINLFPNLTSLELIGFTSRDCDWLMVHPRGLRSLSLTICTGLTGQWLCSIVQERLSTKPGVAPLQELRILTTGKDAIKDDGMERAQWESWLSMHIKKLELKVSR